MFFKGTSPQLITFQNLDKPSIAYEPKPVRNINTNMSIILGMTDSKLSIQKPSGFLTFPYLFLRLLSSHYSKANDLDLQGSRGND